MNHHVYAEKVFAVVFLCLFLTGGLLMAGDASITTLSLADAIDMAVIGNDALEGKRIDVTSALNHKESSWAKYLPSISLTGGADATGSLSDRTGGLAMDLSLGASLAFDGTGALDDRILQSTYEDAVLSYEQAFSELIVEVSEAYWNLVASQESLEVLRNNASLAQEQYEQAQQSYTAGLITELDVLQSKIDVKSAEGDVREAEDAYTSSFGSFRLLLGLNRDASFSLVGSLQPVELELPSASVLFDQYGEKRYDIQLLRLAVKQAGLSLDVDKKTTFSPTVSFSGGWAVDSSIDTAFADTAFLSVSVSVPVSGYIKGSDAYLSLRDDEDDITQAQLLLAIGLAEAKSEIWTQVADVQRLWENIDTEQLNLDMVQRAYELSKEAYDSGLLSLAELSEARQNALDAGTTLVNARLSYVLSTYGLATSLGMDTASLYGLFGHIDEDTAIFK